MSRLMRVMLIITLLIFSGFLRFWQLANINDAAVVLGVLTPILLFLSIRRLGGRIKVAFVGSFILTSLPWHIQESRVASPGVWVLAVLLVISILFSGWLRRNSQLFLMACLSFVVGGVFLVILLRVPTMAKFWVEQERGFLKKSGVGSISNIFTNKFVESGRFYQLVFFENLDLGNYFFSGHPRERLGVKEEQKLYLFLVPLVYFGFSNIGLEFKRIFIGLIILSIALPTLLADRSGSWGLSLGFPIVVLAANGLVSLLNSRSSFEKVLVPTLLIFMMVESAFFFASYYQWI